MASLSSGSRLGLLGPLGWPPKLRVGPESPNRKKSFPSCSNEKPRSWPISPQRVSVWLMVGELNCLSISPTSWQIFWVEPGTQATAPLAAAVGSAVDAAVGGALVAGPTVAGTARQAISQQKT